MKTNYERPNAVIVRVHERSCLCLSNTDNLGGENYEQDEEHTILWNF